MTSNVKSISSLSATFAGVAVLSALAGNLGCTKTCTVHTSEDSVDGELLYTEPLAARDARVGRLRAAEAVGAGGDAERARGTARIVEERRSFEQSVSTGRTVSLTSLAKVMLEIAGQRAPFPASSVVVKFDKPAGAGRHSLADLHASVCERVEQPPQRGEVDGGGSSRDDAHDVCADAVGILDIASSSEDSFDASIVLSSATTGPLAPSFRGAMRLHHKSIELKETCSDVDLPLLATGM